VADMSATLRAATPAPDRPGGPPWSSPRTTAPAPRARPFTSVCHHAPVSKKIDAALKTLVKALEHHGEVMGDRPLSAKKAGRATERVRQAAAEYTLVVADKTGQPNPFVDFLDPETVRSLRGERDAIAAKKGTGSTEPSSSS